MVVNKPVVAGAFVAGFIGGAVALRKRGAKASGPLNILIVCEGDPEPNFVQAITSDIVITESCGTYLVSSVAEELVPVRVSRPVTAKQGILDLFNRR